MGSFGENFERYLQEDFDEARLRQAQDSLLEFFDPEDLRGRSFLDAGCGSGLFSLAAYRLGVSRLVSFDVDERCVGCCRKLARGSGPRWTVHRGSLLDPAFMKELGRFEAVYCWGVAHHTGALWKALAAAADSVDEGGVVYLGVYNHADGLAWHPDGRVGSSAFWKRVKALYAKLPRALQRATDSVAAAGIVGAHLLRLRDPRKELRAVEGRGMSWRQSLRDWLLGHPYEYARPEEVFVFMRDRGFVLTGLRTNNGLLTNHYAFRKSSSAPARRSPAK